MVEDINEEEEGGCVEVKVIMNIYQPSPPEEIKYLSPTFLLLTPHLLYTPKYKIHNQIIA